MKTLIIYASSHGTTQKVVEMIAQGLSGDDVCIVNLKKDKTTDIQSFGKIIIGGSIHAGTVQKNITKYVSENLAILLTKQIGLFVCGMDPNLEKQKQELELAYPAELRKHALVADFLGGEFVFERMNFLEKMIIKKIAKTDKSVSALKNERIENFILTLKS